MVRDERPGYPMCTRFVVDLEGELRPDALREALPETLIRHPLCRSTLVRTRGRLAWQPRNDALCPLHIGPTGTPLEDAHPEIDLEREVGMRIWVRQGGGRAQLLMQCHHAVMDGVGGVEVLADLLAGYAARVKPGSVPLPPPTDPNRLRGRDALGATTGPADGSRRMGLEDLRGGWRWLTGASEPLAPGGDGGADTGDEAGGFPDIRVHTFDVDTSSALSALARRIGVSVNDLLLRDLFLTLAAWNGSEASPGAIRICMPQNLRSQDDVGLPACNAVGFTFLMGGQGASDPERLLREVRGQTEAIRALRAGHLVNQAIGLGLKIPGVFRWMTRAGRCLSTAVLSNLGDAAWSFGARLPLVDGLPTAADVSVVKHWFATPLRPETHASFTATRTGGRLTIAAHVHPRALGPGDGRALLARYVETLSSTSRA